MTKNDFVPRSKIDTQQFEFLARMYCTAISSVEAAAEFEKKYKKRLSRQSVAKYYDSISLRLKTYYFNEEIRSFGSYYRFLDNQLPIENYNRIDKGDIVHAASTLIAKIDYRLFIKQRSKEYWDAPIQARVDDAPLALRQQVEIAVAGKIPFQGLLPHKLRRMKFYEKAARNRRGLNQSDVITIWPAAHLFERISLFEEENVHEDYIISQLLCDVMTKCVKGSNEFGSILHFQPDFS